MNTISNGSCVTQGEGEQHRIRKSLKLYIVLQRNALVDIKICMQYANTAPIPNKNAKVEKITKKLGRGVHLIVIGPLYLSYRYDSSNWLGPLQDMYNYSQNA